MFGSGLVALLTFVGMTLVTQNLGWAAVIHCPDTGALCNGTSGDDLIFGSNVHGLAGND